MSIRSAWEQTRLPDEILIADDGSREETAEMIRDNRKHSPVPLLHVWQPDEGFRAARSRNNAIVASSGDYLVLLDGDCFVNKHFVADHLSVVEKNKFVSGTRVNIVPRRQQYILATGNMNISFFSWGTRKKFNSIRSSLLARFYRGKGDLATANCAIWREDVYRINGFNEAFVGYGWEDSEFAVRMHNAGVAMKKVAHLGMAYHFAHNHRTCSHTAETATMLGEVAQKKLTWCERGLDAPRDDCEVRRE